VAHARVVLGQQVSGEVAAQVAPHGVDVIGLVLGVVVLDEQARTAERVIVAGASLDRPGPPEADLVESGVGDVGLGLVGDGGGSPIEVLPEQRYEQLTL
jgi:hypothetical protein